MSQLPDNQQTRDVVSFPEAGLRPKLLDQVRHAMFHGKKHPSTLGAPDILAFLTWLAVERQVSASTQNQALSALCHRVA